MERIKLNLIPSGVAPIVHLSQYDDGRQFGIDLFEGESVYVLDGTETLTVNSRKPDGHVVTLSVTNTGTSSLDVDTIEQLTAVHGVSYAKLQIVKGSVTIATLPFLIDVSRDPLENGDPSESFVHNLATQISEGVALEVANQYDSANVIFDNAPTSGHGVGYTVTSEGVKTEVDNLNTALAGKVDTTDFDATNLPITSGSATNTKDYIDSKVSGLLVESGGGGPISAVNGTYQIPSSILAKSMIMISLRRYGYFSSIVISKAQLLGGAYTAGTRLWGNATNYWDITISNSGLITLIAIGGTAFPYIDCIGIA